MGQFGGFSQSKADREGYNKACEMRRARLASVTEPEAKEGQEVFVRVSPSNPPTYEKALVLKVTPRKQGGFGYKVQMLEGSYSGATFGVPGGSFK